MAKKLVHLRKSAYRAQSDLCFYCKFPMWDDDLAFYARIHNISIAHARHFECTAEHLIAKKDGGKDTSQNIVAACKFCNMKRHKRKHPPSPDAHQLRAQQRLAKKRWNYQFFYSKGDRIPYVPSTTN